MKKNILILILIALSCQITAQPVLYGTTARGNGTISKYDISTNSLTANHIFNDMGRLPFKNSFCTATDGKLYGLIENGGIGFGVIASYDPSTGIYTKLKDFNGNDGAQPRGSLVQASDGKLYGMTSQGGTSGNNGVIFSYNPSTGIYAKLKDFNYSNGTYPLGSLIQANNGKLYGMTQGGGSSAQGVIFSYEPSTGIFIKVKDFNVSDGTNPDGSFVQASNGKLYGMTVQGGSGGYGVIFSYDPSTGIYTKLKDFNNSDGATPIDSLIQASDEKLYGMTNQGGSSGFGVVFSYDLSTDIYTKLKDFNISDGTLPYGSLLQASDGKLYGMTNQGGTNGVGVVFSYTPSTDTYVKLKDFNFTDGGYPTGNLVQSSDGKLYGMADSGGIGRYGVVFSYNPSTSFYTKLKDFTNSDGAIIYGGLVQTSNGQLYGMTSQGGSSGQGVIFAYNPTTDNYTKLKDFDNNNGASPYGSLVQAGNGKLYGMTFLGGSSGVGVIFSYDPLTSIFSKLKDLNYSDGAYPYGNFIQAIDGKLYGMTAQGGSGGTGVIFSYDLSTGIYTKLKDFNGSDGAYPHGSLVQAGDGKLYGMTYQGGSSGYGVVFSYDPSTGIYVKLNDFNYNNGAYPHGSLIKASDNKLYGMTQSGGSVSGVIFSYDTTIGIFTKLMDFNAFEGNSPQGSLVQVSDGKLYGMTTYGGSSQYGVVFSYDPTTTTYNKLKDFDGTNGGSPIYVALIEYGQFTPTIYVSALNSSSFCAGADLTASYTITGTYNTGNIFTAQLSDASGSFVNPVNVGNITGNASGSINVTIPSNTVTGTGYRIRVVSSNPIVTGGDNGSNITVSTLTTYYRDSDSDGYGSIAISIQSCSLPAGYVTNSTDCDDTNTAIHENCGNITFAIVCPEDKIVNTDTGYCTTVVNDIDVIVTPADSAYTCTLTGDTTDSGNGSANGLTFNKGVTTVTYTLTDDSTKTCSFKVTVNDTQNPTIVCAPDVTINATSGLCTGTTVLTTPTVSDNCTNSFGNALNFDGSDDTISIGNTNLPAGNSPRTFTVWIKTTQTGTIGDIISYGNGANGENFNVGILGGSIFVSSWADPQYFVPASNVNNGSWHHIAVSYDGTNAQTYVDGILLDDRGFAINTVLNTAKIGARRDALFEFFEGSIDELGIWNIALTQGQIQANMNSELGIQPGLVALYHFNQGVAGVTNTGLTTVADTSANSNNGTLNGFALTGSASNWVLGNVVGGELSVTNDAPNEYPIGNTTVTWTATDASNNTVTCTQKVTVVDTENPTIVCAPNVTINTTQGLCTGTTLLVNPAVSDNSINSFGNALNFDGGYVDIPHNDLLNPVNQLTIETWVKITSGGKSLIEKYTGQLNSFGYLLRVSTDNKVFTMVLNYDGPQLTGTTTLLPNVWYHLASTFNRTTGVLKLYVNGVLDGQINGITGLPVTPSTGSLKIGARGDDAAIYSNGDLMDEVRIWNVERTQSQIQTVMNKELSAQAGLVALYHFNQGIAGGNNSSSPGSATDRAIDDSGNGFNGTLNGFTLTGATSNWVLGNTIGGELNVINDAPETYPIGNTTVTWTATDASNNTATCAQTVTLIDIEAPYISAPTEFHYTRTANNGLCFYDVDGGEFDLAATDNCQLFSFFYSMVNADAGLSSTAGSLSGSSLAAGINIISWTATDINGNSSTISFEVEVLKGDITVSASDSEICNGESSELTVSGATSYSWSPSASLSLSTGASVIAAPSQTTTYTVTGTGDIASCSTSKEITVTVTPLPIVTLNTFTPVCVNTALFTLSGGSPLGGTYSGAGVSSGSFNPSVAGVGTHVITYTYNGGNGCSGFATSSIQVNSPIANAGSDKTVYNGYSPAKCTTLNGSASGGLLPYKYLWSTGAKTASINVCPTVTTTYTLKVTDARGCFKTDDVVVNAVDITCAKNSVYICHNGVTQCVKTNDVKTHLVHGDYLGTCTNTARIALNTDSSVIENSDTFILYPNPTTGSFTVEVYRKDIVEGAMIQVVDFNGRIIYSKTPFVIDGHINEIIELNDALPVGVYLVNLIIGEKVETKKIILRE
jgi:uncharacterized repeat protein (TIGR03803 family)